MVSAVWCYQKYEGNVGMKADNIINSNKKTIFRFVMAGVGVVLIIIIATVLLRPEEEHTNRSRTQNGIMVSQGDIANNHIKRDYSDNFTIDADITAPFNGNAKILYAKRAVPDEQKLVSLFMNGKSPKRQVASYDSNCVSYTEGEAFITISLEDGSVAAASKKISQIALPTDNLTTKYDSWKYANMLPNYNTVYHVENLDFMKREDAADCAYSVLKQLHISASREDVEIYAIDCETMQAYQDNVKKEDPDSAANYDIKDKFDKDDEFYIVCFTAIQDQIPITHALYYLWKSEDKVMLGSNIKMYVSKKGVFFLDVNGLYTVQGTAETPDQFLNVQEAADSAFKAYDSVITSDKATVDEIRFEYAPISYNQKRNEAKLTPVWTFHLNKETANIGITEELILINAVTGECIN